MPRAELPPLDLLRGFEAAARNLSFTKAAAELFLTQSAISRQVQGLEDALGVPLFQRRHRALLLTDAGQQLLTVTRAVLEQLAEATRQIRGEQAARPLTVTTTISFASLWLIPRLPDFRAGCPRADVRISADNQILDLRRDRIDVAVRYMAPSAAPRDAVRLFSDEVLPLCSPKLLRDRARPLRAPADLKHHVLLHDDYLPGAPAQAWLEWGNWLAAHGLQDLKPAGDLRFSHYDQLIQAAIAGQGVALGRLPLLAAVLRRKELVAPFETAGKKPVSSRAFFAVASPDSSARPEVREFVAWLAEQAQRDSEPKKI